MTTTLDVTAKPAESLELTPARELSDQFEALKCMIVNLSQKSGRKPMVVAFTSCEIGEGTTSITVNFTAALIRDHSPRVLLVDGNLHRPGLHRFFSLEEQEQGGRKKNNRRGMRQGPQDWQIMQANNNLDVILAESVPEVDLRLTRVGEFCDFLDFVKREYDFVVIDCPPMNRTSSAAVIASKADAVVIVVEAERIRREVIQRAIGTLEDLGANILGIVLNKRRYPIPGFIYRML